MSPMQALYQPHPSVAQQVGKQDQQHCGPQPSWRASEWEAGRTGTERSSLQESSGSEEEGTGDMERIWASRWPKEGSQGKLEIPGTFPELRCW